jgi:predicted HNH restriction endonuclease
MVHHMTYDHLGNEPLADLMGLCPDCHKEVHRMHRATGRRKDLRAVTLEYIKLKRRSQMKKR